MSTLCVCTKILHLDNTLIEINNLIFNYYHANLNLEKKKKPVCIQNYIGLSRS